MGLAYADNVPGWVVPVRARMGKAARIVPAVLLLLACDRAHERSHGTDLGPDEVFPDEDGGNRGNGLPGYDAGHPVMSLSDAGHDAGEDECATVGCSEPPLCSEGCLADCGCCSCADGEQETRNGVALVCTGGCFAPREVDAGPACPAVPDGLAQAEVIEATAYVPPVDCKVQQVMRVDSEQAFQSAFHCLQSESSGIDFSTHRLEMFSAGYLPSEQPYRAPDWARSENGTLTVGWTEVVYCGGPRPLDAYTLALVPVTAPSNVQGAPCTLGMCDPNEDVP